jgi:hypothetical protein
MKLMFYERQHPVRVETGVILLIGSTPFRSLMMKTGSLWGGGILTSIALENRNREGGNM